MKKLFNFIDILDVRKETVIYALYSGWADFEDAIQEQAALENGIDLIITRNVKDYHLTDQIKIMTPSDFVK